MTEMFSLLINFLVVGRSKDIVVGMGTSLPSLFHCSLLDSLGSNSGGMLIVLRICQTELVCLDCLNLTLFINPIIL